MYLTDYHLHTKFSVDCDAVPEQVCEAAIAQGLSEIALTDHMDLLSDKPYSYILDCPAWYENMKMLVDRYSSKIKIKMGVELGQPQCHPSEAQAFLDQYPLDFIIGSIHNLDNDVDVYYYDFQKNDYREVYPRYIQAMKVLATDWDFDVLGHITYPSRYVTQKTGIHPDVMVWQDLFAEVFRILIARGKGLELNLSGIVRGGGDPMPVPELMKLYRQCGGEIVTVGSDAHFAAQAGTVSRLGQEMLQQLGFKYITVFKDRKPAFIKIG